MKFTQIGVLLGALLLVDYAFADPSNEGPFDLGNVHPVGLLHLSQHPDTAEVLNEGAVKLSALSSITNTVNREKGIFLIDAETRVLDLSGALGIAPDLQVGARLPVYYRGSGFTDQPIDEWHQTLGLPRGPRRRIPKDEYTISGHNEDGSLFDLSSDGTGLGNLELNAKYRMFDDGDSGAALVPSLGLPTARSEFGAEQVDLGLSFFYQRTFGFASLFTGASYFHYLDESVENLHTAQNVYAGFIGAGVSVNEGWSFYLGADVASAMIVEVVKYPDYQVYLDFGTRISICTDTELTLGLRENPGPSEGTSDITLALGLATRFGAN